MLNEPQLALDRIQAFRNWLEEALSHNNTSHHRKARSEALKLLPLVRQIARRVDASLIPKFARLDGVWTNLDMVAGLESADLLIGQVAYADEASRIIGPSGPVLAASGLHEWVWDAAKGYWDDGYYEDAVHSAAEVLDHKTQAKLGRRDINGTELYQQAFSPNDPVADSPRLRLSDVDPDDTDTWKSAHMGAMRLGEACSQGIRNPLAHKKTDLTEQQALEQLGALSVLARWVDDSELREVDSI